MSFLPERRSHVEIAPSASGRAGAAAQVQRGGGSGLLLVLFLALGAVAYHGLVFWDPRPHAYPPVVGWFFEASENSPQLVFLLAAGLLFRRRHGLRETLSGPASPGLGALCLAPGVALHLWAQAVGAPDLMIVSLWLVALGATLLLAGRSLARALAAPLSILFFAVPLPGVLHNHVVHALQLATASFVDGALRTVGLSIAHQGDTITFAGREFEVIETCSGLRAIQTLTLLAYAWAVFFGVSARHAALLVVVAPGIAFLTNAIRAMVLVLDPRPEVLESHAAQGISMFVAGAVALFLVDQGLLRFHAAGEPRAPGADSHLRAPVPKRRWRLGGLALALAGLAAASLWRPEPGPSAPARPTPELPAEVPGWTSRAGPPIDSYAGRSSLTYERAGQSVQVLLGWDDLQRRSGSLLSPRNAIPGMAWEIEERGEIELEPGGVPMEVVVARRFASRALTYHAYPGAGSILAEALRATFAFDQPASPWARREGVWLLRLSTVVPSGPEGLPEAEERLRNLFEDLAPALPW